MTLSRQQDAMGQAMWDFHRGLPAHEVAERDDGFVSLTGGPASYFAPYPDWPAHQKRAMRFARGRVLDVGCGAGRHALYLQGKGHRVTGVDLSPLAVRVCKARGLKHAEVKPVTALGAGFGTFDTVLMLGNNFGLFGDERRARWLLRRFVRMTSRRGRILAESLDPHQSDDPQHLAYHRRNRARGRLAGQVRLRVRYKTFKTPYFDYLLVSRREMRAILERTGWAVERFLDGVGPTYVAVLGKTA